MFGKNKRLSAIVAQVAKFVTELECGIDKNNEIAEGKRQDILNANAVTSEKITKLAAATKNSNAVIEEDIFAINKVTAQAQRLLAQLKD